MREVDPQGSGRGSHLSAGVRFAQHIGLPEEAVRGQDDHVEANGKPAQEVLQRHTSEQTPRKLRICMLCPSEAGQIVCLLCAIVATYCLERQTPSCMLSSHRRVAHTGQEIVTEDKDTWQTFAFIGNNILPLHLTRLGLHHWSSAGQSSYCCQVRQSSDKRQSFAAAGGTGHKVLRQDRLACSVSGSGAWMMSPSMSMVLLMRPTLLPQPLSIPSSRSFGATSATGTCRHLPSQLVRQEEIKSPS